MTADVLSDATSRRLYDQHGPEGMQQHSGAVAGTGNARRAWDEFKVGSHHPTQCRASHC